MKRVLAVVLLVALLMVEVAYAEEQTGNQEFNLPSGEQLKKDFKDKFLHYLQSQGIPEARYVTAINGYNWMSWSQQEKLAYLTGFLSAMTYLAQYECYLSGSIKIPTKDAPLNEFDSGFGFGFLLGMAQLYIVSDLPFRTTVYLAEIDAIYSEAFENRSILLADAVYIANERLNHRDVNLEEWRKE